MQMTIGMASAKIKTMLTIIREIESGGSVDHRLPDIANFLEEYISILSNTNVDV